jgi:type II secretory pathway pseudopilin PulG
MTTRREAGFTIISVLVAIVMLSMGLLALSRTGTMAMASQTTAGLRTTALAIARGAMEDVRSRPAVGVVSMSPTAVDETGTPDPNGQFTLSVEVSEVRHNLKEIKVLVAFPRGNVPVELMTLAYVGNF